MLNAAAYQTKQAADTHTHTHTVCKGWENVFIAFGY